MKSAFLRNIVAELRNGGAVVQASRSKQMNGFLVFELNHRYSVT